MHSERSILLVEDDSESARLIAAMLTEMGYTIAGVVTSVHAAETMVLERKPDLVISEVHLNGDLQGLAVAERARLADLPIILISGQPDEQVFRKVKALQPIAFLAKPINRYTLQGAIELAEPLSPFDPRLAQADPLADAIFVKANNVLLRLRVSDILYVRAEGNYSNIVLRDRRIISKMSLLQIIELLNPREFIQVHRNYVVHLREVDSISLSDNELSIHGQIIPVSRLKFRDDLLQRVKMLR
jgi:DNA-binding LytR/AlgR family response regulator